jgi:hypothetical protein
MAEAGVIVKFGSVMKMNHRLHDEILRPTSSLKTLLTEQWHTVGGIYQS